MLKIFISALLLITFHSAYADLTEQQCPNVDLAEKFGPIREQTKYGWCWAIAAADLISFTFGQIDNNRVSPVDVAAATISKSPQMIQSLSKKIEDKNQREISKNVHGAYVEWEDKKFSESFEETGGNVAKAIYAYNLRGGVCTEKQLPLPQPSLIRINPFKKQPAEETLYNWLNHEIGEHLFNTDIEKNAPIKLLNSCQSHKRFDSFIEETKRLANKKALEALEKEIKTACNPRQQLDVLLPLLHGFQPKKGSDVGGALAFYLKEGRPSALAFSPHFLQKVLDKTNSHEALVIGSRWNEETNSCEFKIRNSWGADCNIYPPPYNSAKNCQLGNVWVPEDVLQENSTSVTVVTPLIRNKLRKITPETK